MSSSTKSGMESRKKPLQGKSAVDEAPLRSHRFTHEEKVKALTLEVSGMTQVDAAKACGATPESLRLWKKTARREGWMPAPPKGRAAPAATR